MLATLKIYNYILIDNLSISFDNGLNIFTGETGSGKSVIVNSLKFFTITSRDKTMLFDEAKPCEIEATFVIGEKEANHINTEHKILIQGDQLNLTKHVSINLKTSCYINGKKIASTIFKAIASYMFDFHMQNETYNYVNKFDIRCKIVDEYGGLTHLINDRYTKVFNSYKNLESQISKLKGILNSKDIDKDYIEYQLEEFSKVDLRLDLKNKLEEEYNILSNKKLSEELISTNINILEDEKIGVLPNIRKILKNLTSLHFEHINKLTERVNNVYIELNDCKDELINNLQNLEGLSDKFIDTIKSNLDLIYTLEQKYRVSSFEQLIKKKEELEQKLSSIDNIDVKIKNLEEQLISTKKELFSIAKEITDLRKKAAKMLEQDVISKLHLVGMPKALFNIEVEVLDFDNVNAWGCNNIIFKFSSGAENKCEELTKVASGGELARLVLILKGLVASKSHYSKIMILDEVDTGISGPIAMKTGKLIEQFAQNMQIIIITHLPQVASRRGTHYHVHKKESTGTIQIKQLNSQQDRISHIASMLSGEDSVSKAALQHAKELIIAS